MAALTKGLQGAEMSEIGLLREAGAIAFTDGARSVGNARVFRQILTYARDFDALVFHHTQDIDLVGSGVMNEGETASRLGLPGIPAAAEAAMLERDLRLVALDGRALPCGDPDLPRFARSPAPGEGMPAFPSPPPPPSTI